MMTFDTFRATLSDTTPPPGISPLLQALWHDARNNWEHAHEIAQDIHTQDGSWVHAYLHRKEGDHGNAAYWYRRAARPMPVMELDEEWEQMTGELLLRLAQH